MSPLNCTASVSIGIFIGGFSAAPSPGNSDEALACRTSDTALALSSALVTATAADDDGAIAVGGTAAVAAAAVAAPAAAAAAANSPPSPDHSGTPMLTMAILARRVSTAVSTCRQ